MRSSFVLLVVLAAPNAVVAQPASELCSVPNMPCRYWKPAQMQPGVTYPLIIYLHGAGQRGNNNQGQVNDFADLLRPFLDNTTRAKFPAFVMAPQCPSDDQWVNHPWTDGSYDLARVPESKALKNVRAIITNLRAQQPIDPDRIYVVGYSMGGYGAWDLVARTPELFAAASPVMGGGPPAAAPRLRNLAVWAFHNADDKPVPPVSDREMFEALARAGGRPIYTEGASGGHFEFRAPGHPSWIPWLFAQRRGAPSTPIPDLTFAPAGGVMSAGVAVTITSSLSNVKLRYSVDGTVPRGQAGTAYGGPVKLSGDTTVIAAATSADDEGQVISVFHAASFTVGAMPSVDAGQDAPVSKVADAGTGPADAKGAATDLASPPGSPDASNLGRSSAGCHVAASGAGGWWWLSVLVLVTGRRRR